MVGVWILFGLIGWIAGVVINHLANVLPLRETPFQPPFCRRRLNYTGPEAISTAVQGSDSPPEPVYCHQLRPAAAWSALAAYLLGRQTCSACGKSLGVRSLVVELLTPALAIFLAQRYFPEPYLWLLLAYTAILMVLTVTDLEHRLIQHAVILPAIVLAIIGAFFTPYFTWQQAIVGGAVGFVVFYLLALVARGGLGEGDVTLSAFLGLIVGFPNIIFALIYGIFLGGIVALVLIVTRQATLKTFIPYGPFLALTGWAVLVWGDILVKTIWHN